MDYKLAKQLKDAGFPTMQKIPTNWKEDGLFYPKLEELIDECGSKFEMLVKFGNDWKCLQIGMSPFLKDMDILSEGKTPKEAIANLWLKLNEKK